MVKKIQVSMMMKVPKMVEEVMMMIKIQVVEMDLEMWMKKVRLIN